ncbi:MAG: hypothetical protein U0V87_11075 [Acidobacteriota bacterium]
MMTQTLTTMREVRGAAAWRNEFARLMAAGMPERPSALSIGQRPRVLIPMLVGASELFAVREGFIAHALRQRGADVALVLCDGYEACDARTFDHDSVSMCQSCVHHGDEQLQGLGLPVLKTSEWLDAPTSAALKRLAQQTPLDRILDVHHAGIALGRFVFGSTLRYFRAGRLNLEDPQMASMMRRNLATALLMTEGARRMFETLRPDTVFSSHGVYATWGPWSALARAMNIPSVIYGGGWRANTLICQKNMERRLHCDDIWPAWSDVPLSADEERQLDEYLATREDNRADFTQYFEQINQDQAAFMQRHDLASTRWRRILGAFANVAFDAAEPETQGAFEDMFEWLESLVAWAAEHHDVLLLVKAHPAESRFVEQTPQDWRIATMLAKRYESLPANVRLIAPDDPISPFVLYRLIDIGLVNTSTVGLEMALQGKTVMTTGAQVHYGKPGIVLSPSSRIEYFDTLARLADGTELFHPDRDLVRRYAYTMYFRKSLPFEPIEVQTWEPVGTRIERLHDLGPGMFAGLDELCDMILL